MTNTTKNQNKETKLILKTNCKYYPCHKEQIDDCRYCVCPFYPCKIEYLGHYTTIQSGGKIWDCSNCNLPHKKEFIKMIEEIKEKNRNKNNKNI